ncbi:hypothetical protein Zm00014a_027458, partial [Zea mays]
TIYSPLVYF